MALAIISATLVLAIAAATNADQNLAYIAYSLLAWLMVGLMLCRPFSWSYSFLAVLLLLGHWYKHSVHMVFDFPFVEPTGRFNGSEEQWADYYMMTCAGFAALCIVRAAHVGWRLVRQVPRRSPQAHPASPVQLMTWALLAALVALVYSANFLGAFFMVGVHPTIMLPMGLNAPIAFMVFIGTPLLCACIVAQDLAARRRLTIGALLFLCVTSFIASLSMASRGAIVVHLVPVLAASMVVERRHGNGRSTIAKLGLAAVFLLSVIVAVALYRISLY
jgi:hypothetical protein